MSGKDIPAQLAPETTADTTAGTQETHPDLVSGRRVLAREIEGLRAVADALGDGFIAALDLLAGQPGRVIVAGMGKSGHVARKIAATLASTGTPAYFVHPAEASHGDLGMVTGDDVILALSNSGETPELADLVAYSRRFQIPMIGMTSRPDSTLAKAADVALILPPAEEACPNGLAPTTSTTAMLGLGDAIAVALLERKGFSAEDFHVLHPGGRLGKRLLKVADIMHTGEELPLVAPDTRMADALIEMTSKRLGCIGVTAADGALIGIVTDGDLRRQMRPDLLDLAVTEVMTAQPRAIRPGALVSEALALMNGRKITNLFVVEDGRPVGILHIHDCLRAGAA